MPTKLKGQFMKTFEYKVLYVDCNKMKSIIMESEMNAIGKLGFDYVDKVSFTGDSCRMIFRREIEPEIRTDSSERRIDPNL